MRKMSDLGRPSEAQVPNEPNEERYSVFSSIEKWCITALVAYAAWFSTLSSFIYFPALHQLADYFSVSVGKINLTITSYMAVATVAPMLIGDAADVLGRRPIYVLALGLYMVANIAIASSRTFPSLLGLRVLQAMAISGTFSVAYGVITDIASPAERGSYVSAVSFAITIAPSLGPVLGGAIAFSAGWTWIFWFLTLASGICLALMVFLLPETSRNIVGNGSGKPPVYLILPIPQLMRHWKANDEPVRHKSQTPNPLKSLVILWRKDNATIILACGLLYAVYTCINASLSTLFIEIYQLNQWQAGLVYLPFGLGGTVSTFISGPLLDRAYRNARTSRGLSTNRARGDDLDNFPVEKARLSVVWIPMIMTICSIIAFGWVLELQQVCPSLQPFRLHSSVGSRSMLDCILTS
jgi:predicted MFS family arabinose efflux permease